MKQKIAFIGYYKTFCYQDIGGANSIVRRLSNSMSDSREIFHLTYGAESKEYSSSINDIKQHHFVSFRSMLTFAYNNNILDLMIIYLKPIDYLTVLSFRIFNRSMTFHSLISSLSSSLLKRILYKMQVRRVVNGKIFCVSKQLVSFFKSCGGRVIHLIPPVDDAFFIDSNLRDSKKSKKVRIAFMGRIDLGKGTDIAINYFEKSTLSHEKFEFYVYGYPHESDASSMALHNKLLDEDCKINYVQSPVWDGYSPKVDQFLANLIDEVDLFYLPYRTISSTIDTPLVPLEILARGGLFLATDFPQIKDIISDHRFILPLNEISLISVIDDRILQLTNNHGRGSQGQFLGNLDFKTSSVASLLERSIYEQ